MKLKEQRQSQRRPVTVQLQLILHKSPLNMNTTAESLSGVLNRAFSFLVSWGCIASKFTMKDWHSSSDPNQLGQPSSSAQTLPFSSDREWKYSLWKQDFAFSRNRRWNTSNISIFCAVTSLKIPFKEFGLSDSLNAKSYDYIKDTSPCISVVEDYLAKEKNDTSVRDVSTT